MLQNKFQEVDEENLIKFLNFVAKKANFSLNTQEIIEYYKLLNFMQTALLPKIKANILEVIEVKEEPKESKE